jgi:hypothetical protein
VHIVFGRGDLPDEIDLLEEEGDASIFGVTSADMLGSGVAAVDVDGEQPAELLATTPFGDGPDEQRRESGEVYVLDARSATGWQAVIALPRWLLLYGGVADDAFGAAVTAGDLTGDGKPEIVVLALRSDRPDGAGQDAGAIYVIELP